MLIYIPIIISAWSVIINIYNLFYSISKLHYNSLDMYLNN